MTGTTREIFDKYEVRKTPKQKAEFRKYLLETAAGYGYDAKVEKVSPKCHNVVVGNPAAAKVVYTAHYDTCAVMPFPNFITPKCLPLYILYQVALTIVLLLVPMLITPITELITDSPIASLISSFASLVLLIVIMYLVMAGPANKHTANDNTSGVTLLIDIMHDLPKERMDDVAFIFFDLEEQGLIGSQGYKKKHKRDMKSRLLLNFDCVSDGKTILFALKKKARPYADKISEAFQSTDTIEVNIASKWVFYPSDQGAFNLGVGVAALKKTKKGLLYMDKIHTVKDTVYDEENIEFLKNGAIKLAEIL